MAHILKAMGAVAGPLLRVDTKKQVVHEERFTGQQARFIEARNNAGEVLAIIRALKWTVANQYQEIMIITDSDNVVQWINGNSIRRLKFILRLSKPMRRFITIIMSINLLAK